MPITGQSALVSIIDSKDQKLGFQPVMLCEIRFKDGSYFRAAEENFDSTMGGYQYNGLDWKPRLMSQNLGPTQAVSAGGIVQIPAVTVKFADADGFLSTEYENVDGRGFKGARMTLKVVFWDPSHPTTFSSDSQVKFVGTCNAPNESDEVSLTISATNILNTGDFFLPSVRIGRTCPWVFPVTDADRLEAETNPDSQFYFCGYSPQGTTDQAVGNGDFRDCNYSWENCLERMGNGADIEHDSRGRRSGRFGGIHFDPPSSWRGHAYTTGTTEEGINQSNDAKFNDFFPMIYGTAFVDPPVMQVLGDPNSTRFETVICVGKIHDDLNTPGPVKIVLVNDFVIPHVSVSHDKSILRWQWVNTGLRNGTTNKDAIYDGKGDPYGSEACIAIVVPIKIQSSNSLPNVRVLTDGPQLRVWHSNDPTDFTRQFTSTHSWILADILTWTSAQASDLDLDSFIKAAQVDDAEVTYKDLTGQDATHPRYQTGLALRGRRSIGEVLQGILPAGKSMICPNGGLTDVASGKLQNIKKQTLAGQQPTPVAGSNDNSDYDSVDAAGNFLLGYVAYHFNESHFLRVGDINTPTTFKQTQRPMSDTPNQVIIQIQNEDYFYSPDSLSLVDSEDVARTGRIINSSIPIEGLVNFDQAKRAGQAQFAEQFRGNPRTGAGSPPQNDTGGTWQVEFDSSYRAIHLKIGDIVAVTHTHPKYNLDAQLFRVLSVTPTPNYERIHFVLQWHEDDWYTDRYGQSPDPLLQAQRRHRLLRPPFGWLPNDAAPLPGDLMVGGTNKSFTIAQAYQTSADDSSVIPQINIRGYLPINDFSAKASPPFAPVLESDASPDSIADGVVFAALCAVDEDGKFTAPSYPIATAYLTGGSSSVTLSNIYWQPGTQGWRIYAGRNPNKLTLQDHGTGTPGSITISSLKISNEAMPDVQFDHLLFRAKKVWHSGVFGAAISEVTADTLKLAGVSFTADEWAGRDLSVIGVVNSSRDLPIMNLRVSSNTADTFSFSNLGGASLIDALIKPGDVVVMRTKPDIVTDSSIGDSKFVNEVDYFDPPVKITQAEGSPITLTFSTPHNYQTGDEIYVTGVVGNGAANGVHTISVPSTPDDSYNRTHVVLDVNSDGSYESGGTSQMITHGLRAHEEIGRMVMIIAGTGQGQVRKIVENTTTTLFIDGVWGVTPDETSVFIIVEATWLLNHPTVSSHTSDPTKETSFAFNLPNFFEQVLWVQAFSESADEAESVDSDSPGREIYIFGGPGDTNPDFAFATFNAASIRDIEVDDDITFHIIVRRGGLLSTDTSLVKAASSWTAQAKFPSSGASIILDVIVTKADASYTGSIFNQHDGMGDTGVPSKIVIPAGSTDLVFQNDFKPGLRLDPDDILTLNCEQAGSTQAGRGITVVGKYAVN